MSKYAYTATFPIGKPKHGLVHASTKREALQAASLDLASRPLVRDLRTVSVSVALVDAPAKPEAPKPARKARKAPSAPVSAPVPTQAITRKTRKAKAPAKPLTAFERNMANPAYRMAYDLARVAGAGHVVASIRAHNALATKAA
jgi:hypothetical protein